jgi:hypothetical protein
MQPVFMKYLFTRATRTKVAVVNPLLSRALEVLGAVERRRDVRCTRGRRVLAIRSGDVPSFRAC